MTATLARLALVLALLAGWQAALQHPLEHVDEQGALLHVPGGHSGDGGPLCDELAALTACAAQAAAPVAAPRCDYAAPAHSPLAPRRAAAPPFLAQGPPAA